MQKKLETYFNQFGQTNAVRMRRVDVNKQFKVCFLHPYKNNPCAHEFAGIGLCRIRRHENSGSVPKC